MSPLVAYRDAHPERLSGTSAGGPMGAPRRTWYLIDLGASLDPGTAACVAGVDEWVERRTQAFVTTSGSWLTVRRDGDKHDSAAAILELRRLTGLTWEQLARLFGVARRSLHFWASGKPLNAENEEQLYRTLSVIHSIDRGNAGENRSLLLLEQGGRRPLDLLAARQYDEVKDLLGAGPGRKLRELRLLSPEARAARAPRPPEELTDALQDRVHEERGRPGSGGRARPKRER